MPVKGAKRALIVDDSRSARAFLSRILEKYHIEVDTAESAEHAIEYLGAHRPDVIFMDHLMPGMDGFQAVQAIKNNPRTATIPIMMYTSQEGELYLGQARALGAVGVLPKQIKPTDVSKVLYELHLVPERRSVEPGPFRPVLVDTPADTPAELQPAAPAAAPPPRALTDAALREQFAELRRTLVASLDTQSERLAAELRSAIGDAMPPPPAFREPPQPRKPWGWVVAGIALAALAAGGTQWWRQAELLRDTSTRVRELEKALAAALAEQARLTAASAADSAPTTGFIDIAIDPPEFPGGGPPNLMQMGAAAAPPAQSARSRAERRPVVLRVPYGEEPLGGDRFARLRGTLEQLADAGHRGVIEVSTYAGRFCLVGNSTEGLSLAPDDTLVASCDTIGNPADEMLADSGRMPLAVANLAGEFRGITQGALDLRVTHGDPGSIIAPYPAAADALTAGEWNRAAAANNRIEIRIR